MKEGKGTYKSENGNVYEGELKMVRKKEKEFVDVQMEMFMKPIL